MGTMTRIEITAMTVMSRIVRMRMNLSITMMSRCIFDRKKEMDRERERDKKRESELGMAEDTG